MLYASACKHVYLVHLSLFVYLVHLRNANVHTILVLF
jgi:hypothetical protein